MRGTLWDFFGGLGIVNMNADVRFLTLQSGIGVPLAMERKVLGSIPKANSIPVGKPLERPKLMLFTTLYGPLVIFDKKIK